MLLASAELEIDGLPGWELGTSCPRSVLSRLTLHHSCRTNCLHSIDSSSHVLVMFILCLFSSFAQHQGGTISRKTHEQAHYGSTL